MYYWRCPTCGAASEMARPCAECAQKKNAPTVGAAGTKSVKLLMSRTILPQKGAKVND